MAEVLDKELLKYWDLLDKVQQKSIISMIKSFLPQAGGKDRISVEQYNKEVDDAMARIDAGKFITHEEVIKNSKNW